MDTLCSKCGAHCSQTIQLDDRSLLDCDRCGFVGAPADTAPQTPHAPKAKRRRRPMFGWGSAAFLASCCALGGAIFSFLHYSGQGWTHPRATTIQTALCNLTLCTEYQTPETIVQWQVSQINVSAMSSQTSRITANLLALDSGMAQPTLELILTDELGDQRRRTFEPEEYLNPERPGQIELEFALQSDLISQAEFMIADAPTKTRVASE